jgi:RNA polymerase sigma-70 factor (ECF subfamily)
MGTAIWEGDWRVALTMPVADEAADFVRLVRAELPGAYRLAGYLLRDATEAEDATQDALEKAWQAWPKLRDTERFAAWFDRIVTNVCHDRLRQRRRGSVMELEEGIAALPQARDPFQDALARDEVGRLVCCLPPDQQIVVGLRFWRDLSLEEIADRLQLPRGTVKSRLHYALRTLRAELDRQAGEVRR